MTWPLARNLRENVVDRGDPYLNAWILWWDFHQTFHDPLYLFQAPIFYPYEYTLAFSEHNYGTALPLFPLFALGLRPLTVHALATLFAFALSGYGAFRLTRTLTGSNTAAWVAGLAFAFAPYRFNQLPHVTYLSAGWLTLLFEALLLFARARTKRRAAWLAVVFVMNALTSVHWFVLSLLPLALSGALWAWQYKAWRDFNFWRYGGLAMGVGILVLLPFFIPYLRVQKFYGLQRNPLETAVFSAQPNDWLAADERSRSWASFNSSNPLPERALFPGLLIPFFALLALIISGFLDKSSPSLPRAARIPATVVLLCLSAAALLQGGFGQAPANRFLPPLLMLLWLLLLAHSVWQWRSSTRTQPPKIRSPVVLHGLLWTGLGFFGSLGLNFWFHKFLFYYGFIFRSIRVPARWAMIAILGLSVLAGWSISVLTQKLARKNLLLSRVALALLALAFLGYDVRVAPVSFVKGDADPDAVSLYLRDLPTRGGVTHIPSGAVAVDGFLNHRYTLRQADHEQPLITAFSGFRPPLVADIEELSRQTPIPDRLLDLLEEIPTGYLVLHRDVMSPATLEVFTNWLARPNVKERLRFLRAFPGEGDTIEVYAVVLNAPDVTPSSD